MARCHPVFILITDLPGLIEITWPEN